MWNLKIIIKQMSKYNKTEIDSQIEQIRGYWWGEGWRRGKMGGGD